MRISLADGAWLEYESAWMGRADADEALDRLDKELAWEQRQIVLFGRPVLQPRLIAWAGSTGYRYSGQTLEPRAFTPGVERLLVRVQNRTGIPFNHVLANRYRSGDDSLGLHADDEAQLGEDPVVSTVSLGVSRRFVVAPRRAGHGDRRILDLGHGSLLVMGGTCQRHYRHGVPRQPGLAGERISLTFRRLLRPP
jgi:alkylated DNA repair dioxygenase AlkB